MKPFIKAVLTEGKLKFVIGFIFKYNNIMINKYVIIYSLILIIILVNKISILTVFWFINILITYKLIIVIQV